MPPVLLQSQSLAEIILAFAIICSTEFALICPFGQIDKVSDGATEALSCASAFVGMQVRMGMGFTGGMNVTVGVKEISLLEQRRLA